jgi:hypothetical protein
MLLDKLYDKRWFFWAISIIVIVGLSLASYMEWVNIQIETENYLLVV